VNLSGPSFQFVGFAIIVALLLVANRSQIRRQWVMLVASAVFLASFTNNIIELLPLFGFVLPGYIALRLAGRYPDSARMVAVFSVLLLFVWLKRYSIVPSDAWIQFPYATVGMSYILFRMLHLIIDARDDPSLARVPIISYLTYLLAFNTLVAGPIQSYDDHRKQELEAGSCHLSLRDVGQAAERVVLGLFKTNVLAALLAQQRDESLARLLGAPDASTHYLDSAFTFAVYPLFLYSNFSGYMDIVCGVSRLFLQRLPENFDRPFAATSFIEFWSRWHITLSSWLRTYVYNPLLMALLRRSLSRRLDSTWSMAAFFVTFFLVGVWHGQTTAFLLFGVLQGLGVSLNKLYQIAMARWLGNKQYGHLSSLPLYLSASRGLTFTWFTFTLTWFWASWSQAAQIWSAMGLGEWLFVWSGILLASSILLWTSEITRSAALAVQLNGTSLIYSPRLRTAWLTALLLTTVVFTVLENQSAPEIVYKNF
jgi:D-alanyl-lipoteichoic acid acyltransferase DltB (MBOAT superfamily)